MSLSTGWQRPIGCHKLYVIFHKRATNYGALLRKITCKDKASHAMCCSVLQCLRHPVACWVLWKLSVSQRVAVCCSVLQCVAVCLQCVAVCCSVLQCVAVCCVVLRCVTVCCSVLQCVAVCYNVLQCACNMMYLTVCCSVLQCVTGCCSVLQCVAVCLQYDVPPQLGHAPQ